MDYNGLYTSLLLLKLADKKYLPLPSLQPSYGPFASMNDAKTDLINTFENISNVPMGYTFCVIENGKPQEYWFTEAGNWDSVEPKNVSSSSSSEVNIDGIKFRYANGWLQVSTDNGNTWTNLVSEDTLRGPQGVTGKVGPQGPKGDAGNEVRLEDIKLRVSTTTRTVDGELQYVNLLQISYTGVDGTYYDVGEIIGAGGGSGSGDPISIATYIDGLRYWKQGDQWMTDDQGHMVRAEGLDGQDGEDGVGALSSFKSIVFRRTNTDISNQRPTGGTFASPKPTSGGWFDGIPQGTEKLWMSAKWFYSNESMNDDINNPWSYPSQATDTADLDFEYSNAPVGPGTTPPVNPDTNRYNALTNPYGWYDAGEHAELLPQACWMAIRKLKNGQPYGGWQILQIRGEDGTNGVSPTAHFKSVAFRRSNNYTERTETINGKNTTVYILDPSENPEGGDYNNPNPTNVDSNGNLLWSDGIPKGEFRLWESTCIFHSDGTNEGWTTPRAIGDTEYTDEEWAEENPAYQKPQRRSPDDNNPDYPAGRENDGWDDEPIPGKNYVYKAVRPVSNGEYVAGSDWVVIRIAGERGEDGTSVTIKGTIVAMYSTYEQALADRSHRSNGDLIYVQNDDPSTGGVNEIGVYRYNTANNTYVKLTLTEGDGYLYLEDLWVWDGGSLVNVGKIKGEPGEPGKSYFLHIKYSDDRRVLTNPSQATFTDHNGEDPGKYIGTYVNTIESPTDPDSMDITKYKWQEWLGKDGFGYEYIFRLTSKDDVDGEGNPIAPSVPTRTQCVSYEQDGRIITFNDDDYVPPFDGWTDDPQSPYKQYPYCWVAYRKKVDGVWQAYVGNSTDNSKAALFSMYTSKGRGIESITEMYAVGTSGTVAPDLSAFGPTIPSFDPDNDLKYLWNYEVISYDDDTPDSTFAPACIGVWVAGKGIGKVVEYYYASPVGPKEDGTPASPEAYPVPSELPDAGWSKVAPKLDKHTPYLWNYEVVWFDDNTLCNITTPACIAYYNYTDIEYLMTVFKKVEGNSDTAYLGGLLGVVEKEGDNDVLRAMLNATNLGQDGEVANGGKGKLIIASGFHGKNDVNNATFKVYENGHVEMHDALIQGFLQQYYKNQQAIADDNASPNDNRIVIDPNKCGNYVMLGWQGLGVTGKYELSLSSDTVNKLLPGRITFVNSIYIADNGITYYNTENKSTNISVDMLFPDGTLRRGTVIVLRNGWVELSKVRSLSATNDEVTPILQDLQNVYMLHSWGGNVSMKYGNATIPITNENYAATGFVQNSEYSVSRFIDSTDTIVRIHPQNKSVYINTNGVNEDILYVIMPKMYKLVGAQGPVDYPEPISWVFEMSAKHREIKFKVEDIDNMVDDADVPNLSDLAVASGLGGTSVLTVPNTAGGSAGEVYFKITYYPFMYQDVGRWVVERITPIESI